MLERTPIAEVPDNYILCISQRPSDNTDPAFRVLRIGNGKGTDYVWLDCTGQWGFKDGLSIDEAALRFLHALNMLTEADLFVTSMCPMGYRKAATPEKQVEQDALIQQLDAQVESLNKCPGAARGLGA